jgi:hypothetical protein
MRIDRSVLAATVLLAACSSRPSGAGGTGTPHATAAPRLVPFAHVHRTSYLVSGSDRAFVDVPGGAWIAFDAHGPHDDPAVAAEIERLVARIGDDTHGLFVGRTPLVAGSDAAHQLVARPGEADPTPAPGVLHQVVALGEGEVWRYGNENFDAAARVARDGTLTEVPALPRIGGDVRGLEAVCARPDVWRIARAPDGVDAIVMECDAATDFRLETIHADGSTAVRRLRSPLLAGFETDELAIAADGTPVIAGRKGGELVLARGAADGSWTLSTTRVTATIVAAFAIDADGAAWTITLATGPTGHDLWQLERDGAVVDVGDPSGGDLRPIELAIDRELGVVVSAHAPDGDAWILATHPPPGVVDLP